MFVSICMEDCSHSHIILSRLDNLPFDHVFVQRGHEFGL